jgi:type IV pilus assembly protein PilX
MMKIHSIIRSRFRTPTRERGVVLLFSLISLVVMLIASVALVRSFQSTLFNAGNIAFKRDLQNQSERAVQAALTPFRTGGTLTTATTRSKKNIGLNYSATILSTNKQGIPNAFKSDAEFENIGQKTNDIKAGLNDSVTIRYVIDRLCSEEGDENTLSSGKCIFGSDTNESSSTFDQKNPGFDIGEGKGAAPKAILYRLTVRVIGPRKTMSFFQSTFTVPS